MQNSSATNAETFDVGIFQFTLEIVQYVSLKRARKTPLRVRIFFDGFVEEIIKQINHDIRPI
jgi:hypothetical protein